jgi:hypothetical protein
MTQLETAASIVLQTRNTGNTSWILKAAINSPNCTIVAKTAQQAKHLQNEYFYLLSREPWYKHLYWTIVGRINLNFMCINSDFSNQHTPVIFDNSALL